MSFLSDQNSDTLSQGSLELLIKLVNTYSVAKIMNGIIIILASENYTNIESHKNIIEGRASSYRKFIGDVLLSY
jgi:hypothetical protein